ncbi:hypothetical protein BpHYR1_037217 [Brachionus plicatilis]|uniref:Uncharacterized protein n=1 Tax=Brachionus plicatilis TaxID=10195 RepID=A0A3M7PMH2_BRAPC|nr:hypothetical protein BpHYR1_037217 [Brachionus plicatilis]
MPHTNQMFEPPTATRSLLKRGRKKMNLIPESQSLSEKEPLKELLQTEIQLPNIPVECKWKTYSEFVESFQELRIISLNENDWKLSTCTCPSWHKHSNWCCIKPRIIRVKVNKIELADQISNKF